VFPTRGDGGNGTSGDRAGASLFHESGEERDCSVSSKLLASNRFGTLSRSLQTVPNACATYGLLNIILNLQGTAIERGSLVDSFYDFVSNMTPQMRGHVVSNSTEFYKVHAAHGRASEIVAIRKHTFETSDETGAQPQPQQLQQPQQKEQQQKDEDSGADKELNDPFHFVSFVGVPAEHEHEVWKLDGLQMHPEVVDSMLKGQEDLWVDKALQRMAETMNAYVWMCKSFSDHLSTHFRLFILCRARLESFSILALCDDDVTERQEVAAALAAICSHVESRLASSIFGSKSLAENLLEMDWNKVANAAPIIEMMADLDEAGLRKVLEKLLPAEREERVYVAEKLAQRKKWDVRTRTLPYSSCAVSYFSNRCHRFPIPSKNKSSVTNSTIRLSTRFFISSLDVDSSEISWRAVLTPQIQSSSSGQSCRSSSLVEFWTRCRRICWPRTKR